MCTAVPMRRRKTVDTGWCLLSIVKPRVSAYVKNRFLSARRTSVVGPIQLIFALHGRRTLVAYSRYNFARRKLD